MEILFAIAVFWLFVTVLGHGTWLLLALIGRAVFGKTNQSPQWQDQRYTDRSAFERTLQRLRATDALSEEQASELREKVGLLDRPIEPSLPPQPTAVRPLVAPAEVTEVIEEPASDESELVMATLVESKEVFQAQPTQPVLSKGEIITSFLAARNIRWGELIAGMLIVISSIGLVISLWSPLLKTHRVAPSLIFLTANAFIFAAGFYTLSRWRLRHTSRAILIIATMLVPLSVLAGLAAASSGGGSIADSVRLNDPVTLGSLALAIGIYAWFLAKAGQALIGRAGTWSFMASVAGPVVLLPLIPTAIRWLGNDAGWMIGLASLATFFAWSFYGHHRIRLRSALILRGKAVSRNQLILLSVNLFATIVTFGYFVFIRRDEPSAFWPLMVGLAPAMLVSAAAAVWIAATARQSGHAFAARVAGVLLVALTLSPLPMLSAAGGWLLVYASVFAATCGIIGYQYRQSAWLALATAPLGFAMIWTWPTWMGYDNAGAATALIRLTSGPALLAGLGFTAFVLVLSRLIRDPASRKPMTVAVGCWLVICVAISAALSVLPTDWLGLCPFVVPVGVLALTAVAMLWNPGDWRLPTGGIAAGLTGLSVVAWFRPLTLDWTDGVFNVSAADVAIWMHASLTFALATTCVAFFGVWKQLWETKSLGQNVWRSCAILSCIVSSVLAWFVFDTAAMEAYGVWAIAAGLLLALSIVFRDFQVMLVSQSIVLVVGLRYVHHSWHEPMFGRLAWDSGEAAWAWITVIAAFAVAWLLVEALIKHWQRFTTNHTSLAGWLGRLTCAGLVLLVGVMWIELLADSFGHKIHFDFVASPIVGFAFLAVIGWVWFEREANRSISTAQRVVSATVVAWIAGWASVASGLVESGHLFDVLSVLGLVCVIAWAVRCVRRENASACLWQASIPMGLWTIASPWIAIALPDLIVARWVGWASLIVSGCWIAWIQRMQTTNGHRLCLRALGWVVIIVGVVWSSDLMSSTAIEPWIRTAQLGWVMLWVMGWRYTSRVSASGELKPTGTPATEFSAAVLFALLAEFLLTVFEGSSEYPLAALDPGLWARCLAYMMLAGVCVLGVWRNRESRVAISEMRLALGIATLVLVAGFAAMQVSLHWDTTMVQRGAVAAMTMGSVVGFLGLQFPVIHRVMIKRGWRDDTESNRNSGQIVTGVSLLVAIAIVVWFAGVLYHYGTVVTLAPTLILTVLSLSPIVLGVGVVAEWSSDDRSRTSAIGLGLAMVGMLASVSLTATELPWLVGSMRWWVASIASVVFLWSIVPRLLGNRIAGRWEVATKRGLVAASATAIVSLVAMFVFEFAARGSDAVDSLTLVHKLGVAITIAGVSIFAAWAAISAGPRGKQSLEDSEPARPWKLSDPTRSALIVASQVLMGLVCLHLTLCKAQWALLGLRHYWPFTVMVVAGISIAATQWLSRSGDEVLAKTLKQTSLYLPMVPVIGFWLGGWASSESWMMIGSVIRYEWVLVLAAVYYMGTSMIWKSDVARIVSIVLGNGAIWVVLAQLPGWGFLAHPQLWLIPPAVCVLLLTHFYGDRL